MNSAKQTCIFGPIPSRRLGISLGIDLVPYKTCTMDCIYCECGKTTNQTTERKEYFPTDLALKQIDEALDRHPHIDFFTFSGPGEPLLHSGIGTIIAHIKKKYPDIKVCLLTKGVPLMDPEVRRECAAIDLIVPSLDGSNEEEFQKMNRPAKGLTIRAVTDAVIEFRKISRAQMWLEIFIAEGVNDSVESAKRFLQYVREIRPDKVQLNTLDRPGTEHNVGIPAPAVMAEIASIIGESGIPVECIGGRAAKRSESKDLSTEEYNDRIIATCASRPCTAEDLAESLGFQKPNLEAHLRRMEKAGFITSEEGPRGIYYRAEKK